MKKTRHQLDLGLAGDKQRPPSAPERTLEVDCSNCGAKFGTMEAAGVEFFGPIQRMGKSSWNHFRAPDGTVFEILSVTSKKL